jgi:DNA-binding transcriptional LysR family regulator
LPALSRFRATHPGVELVVNASSTVLNVAQREAEVGLRNVKPDQLSVTVRRVGVLGMAFYGSRRYLDQRGCPTEPQELAQHDLVGWDSAFAHAKAFLWANDYVARVVIRLNDAAVMADAVAADLGIAALPCVLGDERPGLARIDPFGLSRDTIYAVAPGELRQSGRVRAVLDLLVQVWAENESRLGGTRALEARAPDRAAHRRPRHSRRPSGR